MPDLSLGDEERQVALGGARLIRAGPTNPDSIPSKVSGNAKLHKKLRDLDSRISFVMKDIKQMEMHNWLGIRAYGVSKNAANKKYLALLAKFAKLDRQRKETRLKLKQR